MFSENLSIKKRFRPAGALKKNYSHFIEILQAKGHFTVLTEDTLWQTKFSMTNKTTLQIELANPLKALLKR